ncbi:MAG: molybdenum cofactor guanylyltransferase [Desulfobacterales bacterium]|nr:molybdenum cofactor guanylyltransferase [Desulfobacterales bacterium]
MTHLCTGVILSGGLNTRFSGKDKSFIRLGNQYILDSIYSIFKCLFDEIIIVTNNPMHYIHLDATIVTDIFPTRSSLTGLHAGLYYSSNMYSFFVACDTPFLKKELVEAIINQIEPQVDAIVPETSKGIEPLFAIYSKKCLKPIEQQLNQKQLKVRAFLKKVKTKFFPENKIRKIDPDLSSFFNINTPDDLAIAKNMLKKYKNPGE